MLDWIFRRRRLLADAKLLGKWGEKRSERFLKCKGFVLLERGFSRSAGEIDLVMAERNGTIVFVEVKTRSNEEFDNAESAITSEKKARLVKAARSFIKQHRIEDRPCRFDVVAIVLGRKGRPQIRHYENAFTPSD
ncbi:MAG: YraN family protein [Planctomycetota bacterium]